jgi:hypothetical protein
MKKDSKLMEVVMPIQKKKQMKLEGVLSKQDSNYGLINQAEEAKEGVPRKILSSYLGDKKRLGPLKDSMVAQNERRLNDQPTLSLKFIEIG